MVTLINDFMTNICTIVSEVLHVLRSNVMQLEHNSVSSANTRAKADRKTQLYLLLSAALLHCLLVM